MCSQDINKTFYIFELCILLHIMKILPHVMRNINEFNVPCGDLGYEILYFGVNLILMFDYRLSFDIEVQNSNEKIEVLILSRRDICAWKSANDIKNMKLYYNNSGTRINDVFKPSISDAFAFILNNRSLPTQDSETKKVQVTLVHSWQQEVKDSQLKER
jgi:hypothetical protein